MESGGHTCKHEHMDIQQDLIQLISEFLCETPDPEEVWQSYLAWRKDVAKSSEGNEVVSMNGYQGDNIAPSPSMQEYLHLYGSPPSDVSLSLSADDYDFLCMMSADTNEGLGVIQVEEHIDDLKYDITQKLSNDLNIHDEDDIDTDTDRDIDATTGVGIQILTEEEAAARVPLMEQPFSLAPQKYVPLSTSPIIRTPSMVLDQVNVLPETLYPNPVTLSGAASR
jgi:hypothetical protein